MKKTRKVQAKANIASPQREGSKERITAATSEKSAKEKAGSARTSASKRAVEKAATRRSSERQERPAEPKAEREPTRAKADQAGQARLKPDRRFDPTPDTVTHQRGQTAAGRSAQDARAAALRGDRARIVKGNIANAGSVGRGQRGVSGVKRTPAREQPKPKRDR